MSPAEMLKELDEVPWGDLRHALGFATDVPGMLADIVEGSPKARRQAIWRLWGNVYHDGKRFDATPATLRWLLRLVSHPEVAERPTLLRLIVDLLLGFPEDHLITQHKPKNALEQRLYRAFEAGVPDAIKLLTVPDPRVRSGAAYALAWTRDHASTVRGKLAKTQRGERVPEVRASQILALSYLSPDEELLDELEALAGSDDVPPIVALAAAVALGRWEEQPSPPVIATMTCGAKLASRYERPTDLMPWHDGQLSLFAQKVLQTSAGRSRTLGVLALVALLRQKADTPDAELTEALLRAVFRPQPPLMDADFLVPPQPDVLHALVEVNGPWALPPLGDWLRDLGIPPTRQELATFLHVELPEGGLGATRARSHFLIQKCDWRGALEVLKTLVAAAPEDVEIRWSLAKVQGELGMMETAQATLEGALSISKSRAGSLSRLTKVSKQRGALDAALAYAREWCEESSGSFEAHLMRADLLFSREKFGMAQSVLKRAQSLAPHDAHVAWALGRIEARENADKALTYFERAVSLDPTLVAGWLGVGSTRLELGLFDKAISALTQALALDPDDLRTGSALALAQLRFGDVEGGLTTVEELLDRNAHSTELWELAAAFYVRFGHLDEARQATREALRRNPDLASEIRGDPDYGALQKDMGFTALLDAAEQGELPDTPSPGPTDEHPAHYNNQPDALPFPDRPVTTLCQYGQRVLIAGAFRRLTQQSGHLVLADELGHALPNSPHVNGKVRTAESDGSGGWIIAGAFTFVGDVATRGLARVREARVWSFDDLGTEWVAALCVHEDVLYLSARGDALTQQRQQQGVHLGAVSLATGELLDWTPEVQGVVFGITVDEGRMWLAGDFTNIEGEQRSRLAALDLATKKLLPWWGPEIDGRVDALVSRDDLLFLGGQFEIAGPEERKHVCAVDKRDGSLHAWNPDIKAWQVDQLSTVHDHLFVIGKRLRAVDGQPREHIAAFSLPDLTLSDWRWPTDGPLRDVAGCGDDVLVGGVFEHEHSNEVGYLGTIRGLARASAPPICELKSCELALNGPVDVVRVAPQGILVGGAFDGHGGTETGNAAILSGDGSASWGNLGLGLTTDGTIHAAICYGTQLFLAGDFQHVAGQPRTHLAAVDLSTGELADWAPKLNGPVYGVNVVGPRLWLWGAFTRVDGESRPYLAALDAGPDFALLPFRSTPDRPVKAVLTHAKRLIIGGEFRRVHGHRRLGLAALDPKTGSLQRWNPRLDGHVSQLAQHDGNLIVGGSFRALCGTRRACLGAIEIKTGLPTTWDPRLEGERGGFPEISALRIVGDELFVAGHFEAVQGRRRRGMASFHLGDCWRLTEWRPSVVGTVRGFGLAETALVVAGDGEIEGARHVALFQARVPPEAKRLRNN